MKRSQDRKKYHEGKELNRGKKRREENRNQRIEKEKKKRRGEDRY